MTAPSPDDLRAWHASAEPVQRWFAALDDLLGAVAVAGLAWPDADLPDDLRALAEAGGGFGAEAGAARLAAFGEAAAAVREAPVGPERIAAEGRAFTALMAVVAWRRRIRRELDLVEVQAALVVRGTSEAAERPRGGPVLSGSFGVVGVELVADRLAIHALDLDRGTPALLVDRVDDVDPADPFGRPLVSRLFQARVRLGEVLRGAIALRDHPVSQQGSLAVVRPAFDAVAVARPRREAPPLAPPLPAGGFPAAGAPARLELALGRAGDRAVVRRADGASLEVPETAILRFNLTKLALRDEPVVTLPGAVGVRQANPALLAVDHPVDGRGFPAVDPRAFPLSPASLRSRVTGEGPEADWLRAGLSREAGEAPPADLERRLAAPPATVEAAFWAGRAARVLGLELPPAHLALAARQVTAAPTATARWWAVWLLLGQEDDATRRALRSVWTATYEQPNPHPEPADLCARAALIPLFPNPGEADPAERAVSWLDAHLAVIRGRAHQARGLPALGELAWLAEVRVMLTGDHAEAPLRALDLPPDAVRSAVVEALWAAFAAVDATPTVQAAAGDAVWAMRLAGWREQLWAVAAG